MAVTRRSTRIAVPQPALTSSSTLRRGRPRSISKIGREESDKENSPPITSQGNSSEKGTTQTEICGICLDNVNADRGSLPVCVHAFCFECIHQWSKTSNTCPMCKAKFRMISRTEANRKPKRVRVSDVDQRPEYSDPDPDDFLTDEEDEADEFFWAAATLLGEVFAGDAWMDADDGEFAGYISSEDEAEEEGEDEEIDEEELNDLMGDDDNENEDENENGNENSWETHLAHARVHDRGLTDDDSDFGDDECIIEDAPVTRSRARSNSRSGSREVIVIDDDEDEVEEDDGEEGDDEGGDEEDAEEAGDEEEREEEEEEGPRRSKRLRNGVVRQPTHVINLDSEEEQEESDDSVELDEIVRDIHTRSRNYPGSFDHGYNDQPAGRMTRSRSRGAIPTTTTTTTTTTTYTPRYRNNHYNNYDTREEEDEEAGEDEDEDDGMERAKRLRKSPTRYGFNSPTTTTTTSIYSTYTNTYPGEEEEEDEEEEGEDEEVEDVEEEKEANEGEEEENEDDDDGEVEEMEGVESARYNLRSRRC